MEIPACKATRLLCLYGFLVTSLLFSRINADGKIKQVTDPTGNVNLSPFQQWRRMPAKLLTCIMGVNRDYKFTTVQDLNFTITHGCDFGFNRTTFIGDA